MGGLIWSGLSELAPAKMQAAEFSVQTSRGGFYLNTGSRSRGQSLGPSHRGFREPSRQYYGRDSYPQRHFGDYPSQTHHWNGYQGHNTHVHGHYRNHHFDGFGRVQGQRSFIVTPTTSGFGYGGGWYRP